jgi:four helix bundle protein
MIDEQRSRNMKPHNLKDRTKTFAISVLKYLEKLPYKNPYIAINNQLTRCSMSVGANYRAASRAKSTADFINKLKIVEEECDETMYFLEILMTLIPNDKTELEIIYKEANELLSITVASIKTVRNSDKNVVKN